MKDLKKLLKHKLKNAKRIAVLGIGSELRGDDAAGILAAEEIKAVPCKSSNLKIFLGATAPENLTGEIKKYKPTHLVIIDSAEIGKKPGTVALLELRKIEGVAFSTHRIPLNIMVDYLRKFIDCKIIIIGIQPKSLEFGSQPSEKVILSVKKIASALKEIIKLL